MTLDVWFTIGFLAVIGAFCAGWYVCKECNKVGNVHGPCPGECPLSGTESDDDKRVREERETADAWRRMQDYSAADAYGGDSG